MTLHTIGHSTRAAQEFLDLLLAHGICQVADVRTVPRSRRHPHFNADAIERQLAGSGLGYRHFAALGGLRRPRPDSPNTVWRNAGFRGYADYMSTEAFVQGLELFLTFGAAAPTALLCAEAVWWRCHRALIADALLARGHLVRHILSAADAPAHKLTPFARVRGGRTIYCGLF